MLTRLLDGVEACEDRYSSLWAVVRSIIHLDMMRTREIEQFGETSGAESWGDDISLLKAKTRAQVVTRATRE